MPFADSEGIRIYYDDTGEGEPALLCLPGWCNTGQGRERKAAYLWGICNPLHTPATPDGSLVMSRGKRFESARRLSR